LRVEQKSFSEIGRALNVSPKTISRWENGWTDKKGRKHAGWLSRLEQTWQEIAKADLGQTLMLRNERLKTCEELARMILNRVKGLIPSVKVKTAKDVKALLSEARELLRLIAHERGESMKAPHTLVAVKADISLDELQERYAAAKARRAEYATPQEGEANDRSDIEETGGAEGHPGLADKD